MRIKKFMSVLLIVALMFSFCSFFVSAADGTGSFDVSSMTVTGQYNDGSGTWTDCTNELKTGIYNNSSVLDGMYYVRFPISLSDKAICLYLSEPFSISANHEYNLNFDWGFTQSPSGVLVVMVYLNFYDSNGELIAQQLITSQSKTKNFTIYNVDIDFKPKVDELETGYKCRLEISFTQDTSPTASEVFCISQQISLTDKDDNSSWFQKIINAIKELPSNFVNGIKGFFDNLGNKISELGDNIQSFFVDLGENIGEFFTMLKNYLLYFQHPVTTNSDGVLVDGSGNPVYTNPFDSAMNSVKNTVDGWLSDIDDFIADIDESRLNVKTYLETGSGVINDVLGASPILSAAVIFAAAFLVIRKVVGR